MYATNAKVCLGSYYLKQPRLTKFEENVASNFIGAVFFLFILKSIIIRRSEAIAVLGGAEHPVLMDLNKVI
jgi:hypothetical protein